jgi:hypothetical protein
LDKNHEEDQHLSVTAYMAQKQELSYLAREKQLRVMQE